MCAQSEPAKSCRFLVSLRDPTTFFAFPSPLNGCGRFEPAGTLPGSYQSRFCLTVRHAGCKLLDTSWTGPFPARLEGAAESEWGAALAAPRRRWGWTALAVLGILAVGGAAWWLLGAGWFDAPANAQGAETPLVLVLPEPTWEPTATSEEPPMALPSPWATAAPTETALPPMAPTPGPSLEMPFGAEPPYLIHSVQAGDSLYALAEGFGCSAEAIRAANGLGEQALAIGQLLVIPLGIFDPADVPMFVVSQVGGTGEALADLAARYGVDPESIRRTNALGGDPMLPPGRWLIVPVAGAE